MRAKANVHCSPAGRRIMPLSSSRRVAVGCAPSRAPRPPRDSRAARLGRAPGAQWARRAPAAPRGAAPMATTPARCSGGAYVARVVRGLSPLAPAAMRPDPDLERRGSGRSFVRRVTWSPAHHAPRAALLALGAEEAQALEVAHKLARRFAHELDHTDAFN